MWMALLLSSRSPCIIFTKPYRIKNSRVIKLVIFVVGYTTQLEVVKHEHGVLSLLTGGLIQELCKAWFGHTVVIKNGGLKNIIIKILFAPMINTNGIMSSI